MLIMPWVPCNKTIGHMGTGSFLSLCFISCSMSLWELSLEHLMQITLCQCENYFQFIIGTLWNLLCTIYPHENCQDSKLSETCDRVIGPKHKVFKKYLLFKSRENVYLFVMKALITLHNVVKFTIVTRSVCFGFHLSSGHNFSFWQQ